MLKGKGVNEWTEADTLNSAPHTDMYCVSWIHSVGFDINICLHGMIDPKLSYSWISDLCNISMLSRKNSSPAAICTLWLEQIGHGVNRFSIVYLFFKNRIRKIPFIFWIIFAILPMAIDGTWQLLSTLRILNLPNHESNPLIRSLTGGLFGFFSGWYLLPTVMDSFKDVNQEK